MGMVGHLFQNCDTIDVRFFATYTCDLSCFVGFFPKYVTIFFSDAHIHAHNKSPHICDKSMHVWGHRKSSYKSHRIIQSAKTPLRVR